MIYQKSMSDGDYFSPFSGLLEAFLFQRELGCDDKWGLPKLTGDSLVILFGFQRENTTLVESKKRQNYLPSTSILHSFHSEIFVSKRFGGSLFVTVSAETKTLYIVFWITLKESLFLTTDLKRLLNNHRLLINGYNSIKSLRYWKASLFLQGAIKRFYTGVMVTYLLMGCKICWIDTYCTLVDMCKSEY